MIRTGLVPGRRTPLAGAGSVGSYPRRHRLVALVAALMAIAGCTGAVGLIGGGIDFGGADARILDRIPFHSPLLAGVGLLVAVALPMTAAAIAAWRGITRAGDVVTLAGLALIGWILVEVAIIRTYSWMQPVCGAYGVFLAALGARIRRTGTPHQHG